MAAECQHYEIHKHRLYLPALQVILAQQTPGLCSKALLKGISVLEAASLTAATLAVVKPGWD